MELNEIMIWGGIFLCLSQSAMFSGLNLAFFSISKLRLRLENAKNNAQARIILQMRDNANYLLATILWGNVAINVLLTLLSHSVLAGAAAFLFSTFFITLFGEIAPQAYFSRNALAMASRMTPLLKVYMTILYPVAKPTAILLDRWVGREPTTYYKEQDFHELIRMHLYSYESEISPVEATGATNFLTVDDMPIAQLGEPLEPKSVMTLDFKDGVPVFPSFRAEANDPFIRRVMACDRKWVVLIDAKSEVRMVLQADSFVREVLFEGKPVNALLHCHRPILVKNPQTKLGDLLSQFKVHPTRSDDDVIDHDIIICWGKERRIVTGSDILGKLLKGVAQKELYAEVVGAIPVGEKKDAAV